MFEINILREALWKTSHEYRTLGTHDGEIISEAFEALVVNFESLLARANKDEE